MFIIMSGLKFGTGENSGTEVLGKNISPVSAGQLATQGQKIVQRPNSRAMHMHPNCYSHNDNKI